MTDHDLTVSQPKDFFDAVTAIASRRGRRAGLTPEEIDDVVQTVLASYLVKRRRGERPRNPGAYLETATQNAIIDLSRRADRVHAVAVDPVGDLESDMVAVLQMERSTEYGSRSPVLARLLDEVFGLISAADADLVRRSALDGASAADLADGLGVSVAAAQQRLSRARSRLRDGLAARPDLLEELHQDHPQVYAEDPRRQRPPGPVRKGPPVEPGRESAEGSDLSSAPATDGGLTAPLPRPEPGTVVSEDVVRGGIRRYRAVDFLPDGSLVIRGQDLGGDTNGGYSEYEFERRLSPSEVEDLRWALAEPERADLLGRIRHRFRTTSELEAFAKVHGITGSFWNRIGD